MLFDFDSTNVAAMMPAIMWQTELTWDRKAPGLCHEGAPKATFYNLAGELQCEVILPQIFLTWGDVVCAANWEGERLGLMLQATPQRGCLFAGRRPPRGAPQEAPSA